MSTISYFYHLFADKYFTNFDNGFGIWSNVKGRSDPLDWQIGRGRTSRDSGPTTDHTDGTGRNFLDIHYTFCRAHIHHTRRRKAYTCNYCIYSKLPSRVPSFSITFLSFL